MTVEPRHRPENIFSQDTTTRAVFLFKMEKKETDDQNSVVGSKTSHRCGLLCLGPLTFYTQAVGHKIRLSKGCRRAERNGNTFRGGLVFSNRPVRARERIRLRVEKNAYNWHGGLRVGFTNVAPWDRFLPLPDMAIPNLTETPGHWASPVHESYCQAGSELEFWVSCGGSLYVTSNNTGQLKLLTGVDLSKPLWAMIDIYGQTCSIFLLGSEKVRLFCTKRSCPAPECLTSPDVDKHCGLIPDLLSLDGYMEAPAGAGSVMDCVVCMDKGASVALPCGHRCLCDHCGCRVLQQFGTCPLCRQSVSPPSAKGRHISALLQDTKQD